MVVCNAHFQVGDSDISVRDGSLRLRIRDFKNTVSLCMYVCMYVYILIAIYNAHFQIVECSVPVVESYLR